MKYYGITMVVCPTCRHEHAGPLKTCPVCRDRIATWKQKHRGKDRLHKRKYAAKKRGSDDYDELFYSTRGQQDKWDRWVGCLLYTSDAADEEDSVDLGGR